MILSVKFEVILGADKALRRRPIKIVRAKSRCKPVERRARPKAERKRWSHAVSAENDPESTLGFRLSSLERLDLRLLVHA